MTISKEAEFHILRHFNKISFKWRERLNSFGFSDAQIDEQLKIFGSKFDSEFCDDIELLKNLYFDNFSIDSSKEKTKITLTYTHDSENIGFDTLHNIENIEDPSLVKKEKRDIYQVNTINLNPVPTNQINFILTNKHELITCFPGKLAPPFPDLKRQSEENYKESTLFWNNHALCVVK